MSTPDAETELRRLLLAGLDGDEAAYRRFLQQLAGHLRAYLGRRLFGWPDDVEDLVQECLLAMHNKRHTYQSDQPLTAWVHAIARHKLIDLWRRHGRRAAELASIDDLEDHEAPARDDREERTASTRRALRDRVGVQVGRDRHGGRLARRGLDRRRRGPRLRGQERGTGLDELGGQRVKVRR